LAIDGPLRGPPFGSEGKSDAIETHRFIDVDIFASTLHVFDVSNAGALSVTTRQHIPYPQIPYGGFDGAH
jgi:hypothetical protein